jgi:hypothetical protein
MNNTTLNLTTLDGGNVIIKRGEGGGSTPTPPSGGESGSNVEYLDIRGAGVVRRALLIGLADSINYASVDKKYVGLNSEALRSLAGVDVAVTDCLAVSIDFSRKTKIIEGDIVFDGTLMDVLLTMNIITQADLDSIPRLTKEQFYSLD